MKTWARCIRGAFALYLIGIILACICISGAAFASSDDNTPVYVPNEYIITVQPGSTKAEIDEVVARLGAKIVSALPLPDMYLVRMDPSKYATLFSMKPKGTTISTATIASTVSSSKWVIKRIQPNFIYKLFAIPNDQHWDRLWGMKAINMPTAWEIAKGRNVANPSKPIVVAVLDTGVAAQHPDLQGRLLKGYDFFGDDENNPGSNPDDDPNDTNGHGTHVSGIIAAQGNNGIGVVGVCWDDVKILPVRVFGSTGGAPFSVIVAGLNYALQQRADVVNLSLGGYYNDPAMQAKIRELAAAGIILVAAAGNASGSAVAYPARYPECIAVSAVGPTEQLAYYSNYGSEIDIAAPGGDSEYGSDGLILSTVPPNGYQSYEGTSMACPHVAGAAALLLSNNVPKSEVASRLISTARAPRTGTLDPLKYGAGILDVQAALSSASVKIISPAKGATVSTTPTFRISVRGVATSSIKVYIDYADVDNGGRGDGLPDDINSEVPIIDSSNISNYLSSGTITFTWPIGGNNAFSPGSHFIYVRATSSQDGSVVYDWARFDVASRVIRPGVHLFSFPYSLDTAGISPANILQGTSFVSSDPRRSYLWRWIGTPVSLTNSSQVGYKLYDPTSLTDMVWVDPLYSITGVGTVPTGGGYYYNSITGQKTYGFPAGTGYWLIVPSNLSQSVVVSESYPTLDKLETFDKSKGYTIPIYAGWNMIGNPYGHAVPWGAALFTYQGVTKTLLEAHNAGWIRSTIYGYDSTSPLGYVNVTYKDFLQPYCGYWLRALVGGVKSTDKLELTIQYFSP